MKNYLFFLFLIIFFVKNVSGQDGVIHLENPSFEGWPAVGDGEWGIVNTPKGIVNCGFPNETPPDVHPVPNNPFGVTTLPLHGSSYLGLVVREYNTWERVSQELSAPLQAGITYVFKIHLARSAHYMSPTQSSNGRMVNLSTPCQLRIWGGHAPCMREELLVETGAVTETMWMECKVLLRPTENHQYLTFEAYYVDQYKPPYYGNLLIDLASNIVPVDSFDVVEMKKLLSKRPNKNTDHLLPDHLPENIPIDSLSVDELQQLLNGQLIESYGDKPIPSPKFFRHEFEKIVMGAEFKMVLYAENDSLAEHAAQKAIERIKNLESIFSYEKKDSEISRLQEIAGTNKRRKVSNELWEVLMLAQKVTAQSKGAYDYTSGALVNVWDNAFLKKETPPDRSINEALTLTGADNIIFEADQQIHITQPGLLFHIDDIAKGYISDQTIEVFKAHGITAALVDNGKSKVSFGSPNANDSWQLERPEYRSKGLTTTTVSLSDQAIATFGHPYKYIEKGSLRYSNILDCQSGLGTTKKEIVSVVAPTCAEANAWALALSCTENKNKIRAKVKKEGGRSFVSEF